ncbi:MAG: RNA polymerase sigma factor [Armatimonadota bacterium]
MHTEHGWRQWLLQKAVWLCSCEAEAEDLVQDCLHAFYRCFCFYPWQRPLEPDELRHARAWCKRKLQALAIDRAKQPHRQRELQLLDTEIGEYLAVSNPEDGLILQIALEQFIAHLPVYLQKVAELYNRGYDYREIARRLELSEGSVRQYMRRINKLGQAFFGLDVHKSAVSVVNRDGSPKEGFPEQLEEEPSDEKTQGIADERGCADDSELGGTTEHPCRPRRTQRGG